MADPKQGFSHAVSWNSYLAEMAARARQSQRRILIFEKLGSAVGIRQAAPLPMNITSLAIPLLYQLVVLGLCAFLLIRGITHAFVCLFAGGALLELIRSMAFVLMSVAPGGFSANAGYLPIIAAVGYLGMVVFLAGFFSLTAYFLRAQPPQA